MILKLVISLLITELSSKPISNEEMLMQSNAVTPSVDPNAIKATTPELNLEWSRKPISNEEMLVQSTVVTPPVDANTTEETTPKSNRDWRDDPVAQRIKQVREFLIQVTTDYSAWTRKLAAINL